MTTRDIAAMSAAYQAGPAACVSRMCPGKWQINPVFGNHPVLFATRREAMDMVRRVVEGATSEE